MGSGIKTKQYFFLGNHIPVKYVHKALRLSSLKFST